MPISLALSNLIYSNTGVRVVSLEEAIDLNKTKSDEMAYQPVRLENSNLQIVNLENFNLEEIVEKISRIYSNSDRHALLKELRSYVINRSSFESRVLTYDDQPCIVYISTVQTNNIEIPLIRITSNLSLSSTLFSFVINRFVEEGIYNSCLFIKINDFGLRDLERSALEGQYFTKSQNNNIWLKPCHREILSSQQIIQYLNQISTITPEYLNVSQFISSCLQSQNLLDGMDIKRILWPLKIEDYDIPSFIIPIKPEYAKELFDRNLAQENLFGIQRSDLFLSLDRVYYKNPNPNAGLKKAPARVLWYVSGSKDKGYSDLSSIRACSQVDNVVIGSPEEVYRKFQHLGYYDFEKVQKCAKNNKVMAIKFSHTELLNYPVDRSIINQCLESKAPLQSMRKIWLCIK